MEQSSTTRQQQSCTGSAWQRLKQCRCGEQGWRADRRARAAAGRAWRSVLLLAVVASLGTASATTQAVAAAGRHTQQEHQEQQQWQQQDGSSGANQQRQSGKGLSEQQQRRRLSMSLTMPHTWPGFLVPERERHLGLAYAGDWGRLRAALARFRKTGNLTVAVVGGSISAGAGALGVHNWVEQLEDWMALRWNATHDPWMDRPPLGNPRVHVTNGAVPGTYSSYMSVCYNKHVPRDADVVVVEYALNDEQNDAASGGTPSGQQQQQQPRFDNLVRRAFERLLRKLLTYPNQPAVILLNAYAWFQLDTNRNYDGMYTSGSDADFFEFASYYQLPMLSIKSCCWRLMQQGAPGFQVNRTRAQPVGAQEPQEVDQPLRHTAFYWDKVHPNGETGHRVMSDLVVHLLLHADKSLQRKRWSEAEAAMVHERSRLPAPMIRGNWESGSDRCFVGDSLQEQLDTNALVDVPADAPRFEWANDQPPNKRPKWGFVANQTGAAIRFKIDTRTASFRVETGGLPASEAQSQAVRVAVEVAHLRSYQGMGTAEVTCVSGCLCVPTRFDGHHDRKVSLVHLTEVIVSTHPECILEVRALGPGSTSTTSSPATTTTGGGDQGGVGPRGSKVKITGLMISDEGGDVWGGKDLKSFGALDYVMEGLRSRSGGKVEGEAGAAGGKAGTAAADGGTFEVQNTWR